MLKITKINLIKENIIFLVCRGLFINAYKEKLVMLNSAANKSLFRVAAFVADILINKTTYYYGRATEKYVVSLLTNVQEEF
jgi:hypothetical protein